MDRAELERDVEGARRPCGLEKEWTGLSWNEMWRELEDRVDWKKFVSRVGLNGHSRCMTYGRHGGLLPWWGGGGGRGTGLHRTSFLLPPHRG